MSYQDKARLKKFKKLAIDLEKFINSIFKEAMKDLLKEYETRPRPQNSPSHPINNAISPSNFDFLTYPYR